MHIEGRSCLLPQINCRLWIVLMDSHLLIHYGWKGMLYGKCNHNTHTNLCIHCIPKFMDLKPETISTYLSGVSQWTQTVPSLGFTVIAFSYIKIHMSVINTPIVLRLLTIKAPWKNVRLMSGLPLAVESQLWSSQTPLTVTTGLDNFKSLLRTDHIDVVSLT